VLRLGFLDFEQSDFANATMRFRRALALQPRQQEVAYFLAVSLRREGELAEAQEVFLRVTPDHPRFAEARTQLASMSEKGGDLTQAIAYVEEARTVAPSRPLDLYLGSLRAKNGDVAGALVFLESLLDATSDDADVLYNIGVIHGEASNVDEAIRTMRAVLGMNPDHAGALNYVGYTWAERGENLLEAEAFIERALEQRPGDGYITDSLGWIYYMRARPMVESGETEAARELIERAKQELGRAAELTGGDPVISEHLGDVYLLQGDRQRALELYEEAWQLGPRENEQPQLGEKLERLRRELGHR
jgi:tetratricopeptide (TPR) repeat protein